MATQQIVPQVVSFPQSVPTSQQEITQLELELFLALSNRLTQLQAQVATEEATLKSRIEAGAEIEPGSHRVELKESFRRNVSWKSCCSRLAKRLGLDGAAYCARVLGRTKPARSVSLEIS